MKGRLSPRILALPLFLALIAAPAIMQEGLVSLWAGWGIPLLGAAGAFALLAGLMRGAWALGSLKPGRRAGAARAGGEPDEAVAAAGEPESGADAAEKGEGEEKAGTGAEAEGAEDDAAGDDEAIHDEAAEDEEEVVEPDPVLSEALDELEDENFMDLARALQEMGRHGDALEVLARAAELKEGGYGEEVARALRRMRLQLGVRDQQAATRASPPPPAEIADTGETGGQAPGEEPSPAT